MLTVDVGNSSIGIGSPRGGGIEVTVVSDPAQAARLLEGEVVGIAVSLPRWEALADAVAAAGNASLRRLDGVPLPVADPRLAGSAGADRLAAALGALPGPVVVVDAGTAVTVDLVDGAGVFRGGFIAPGPGAALAGLHSQAPALPRIPDSVITEAAGAAFLPVPGLDTMEAMSGGAWGMAVGGVDRLVDAALDVLEVRGAETVELRVTGGWGRAWLAASRHGSPAGQGSPEAPGPWRKVGWDEALVHRGILRWAGGPE